MYRLEIVHHKYKTRNNLFFFIAINITKLFQIIYNKFVVNDWKMIWNNIKIKMIVVLLKAFYLILLSIIISLIYLF